MILLGDKPLLSSQERDSTVAGAFASNQLSSGEHMVVNLSGWCQSDENIVHLET